MSKIHLLFEYQNEKNKYLIIFINNITDYAYRSASFLSICLKFKDMFNNNENNIKLEELCSNLTKEILQTVKEKSIKITYAVYVAMHDLLLYRHRYPHTKKNNFIFEKAMFLEVEDKSNIDADKIIDAAALMLPINFKLKKEDKSCDGILITNDDSIFYTDDFLKSDDYTELYNLQKEVIIQCQNLLHTNVINILCLHNE